MICHSSNAQGVTAPARAPREDGKSKLCEVLQRVS